MAIKPGMGRKSSKSPPILSHEFVIQNHADIISCVAMVFVVGLTLQGTSSIANLFISLHHHITPEGTTEDSLRDKRMIYESGVKDYCAVFFYTLICIIMHAILQEYLLDKVSKRLHLSKYKLSLFNESGQLIVFYLTSFFWGVDVIIREGYISKFNLLWSDFPNHPMIFLHKLYFVIQLAYYLHMLPELYFQRIKKEDRQPKIIHSVCGFIVVASSYFLGFQRIALVLLTLHYLSEIIAHLFQLISVFDRDEKYSGLNYINSIIFVLVRFSTMVISVLTLYYGVANTEQAARGFIALICIIVLQGYLIFSFITEQLKAKRERALEAKQQNSKKSSNKQANKDKSKKKKESDLPEADQSPINLGKIKTR
ncbi:translocating chain-associated membrane protein 1 [Condylostylus longicornis]|uniref:translocating chain-associated membrane protein 1 n=1 Tax=Condylostylus longicornis TaxID=2530218 RepID=UPI00244E4506|nr:translocating chain-associated membrane protein 1 [Condylostylus longicornis]